MIGSIEDPQVKISVPKDKIISLKNQIKHSSVDVPVGLQKKLEEAENVLKLTASEVSWVRKANVLERPLHEWLSTCEVELPQPPVLPRDPVLEARVQRLQLEQQERDYQFMTKNVDNLRYRYPDESIASQVKEINRQLIAVLQFVVSVGAGFAFGFIGIELMVGDLDFGFRLLLGVMCALIIALAEIYFLAKQLAEDVFPPVFTQKSHQD